MEVNHYVVYYSDGKGNDKTIIFDHSGDEVAIDKYIHDKSFSIVYDYEHNIESQIAQVKKRADNRYILYTC